MLLLNSVFSGLRLQLGCLELGHRHIYLFDDEGIGRPKQGTWGVGCWGLRYGGLHHNDQCGHYTQDIVLNLLGYEYYGISRSCQHIVYQLFLIIHCLPKALAL